jgi:hypothetical protein
MTRFLDPRLLSAIVFLAGCKEGTGPRVTGRWAATGIELTLSPSSAEFRLACAAPAQLSPGLGTDSAGAIRFSTPIQPLWGGPFHVDFVGRIDGLWLFATMTRTFSVGAPVVQQYALLRGGDAGFDRVFCPQ